MNDMESYMGKVSNASPPIHLKKCINHIFPLPKFLGEDFFYYLWSRELY